MFSCLSHTFQSALISSKKYTTELLSALQFTTSCLSVPMSSSEHLPFAWPIKEHMPVHWYSMQAMFGFNSVYFLLWTCLPSIICSPGFWNGFTLPANITSWWCKQTHGIETLWIIIIFIILWLFSLLPKVTFWIFSTSLEYMYTSSVDFQWTCPKNRVWTLCLKCQSICFCSTTGPSHIQAVWQESGLEWGNAMATLDFWPCQTSIIYREACRCHHYVFMYWFFCLSSPCPAFSLCPIGLIVCIIYLYWLAFFFVQPLVFIGFPLIG